MIPNSVKTWQNRHDKAQKTLMAALIELDDLKSELYAFPLEELADIGYLLRETSKFYDTLRKRLNDGRALIELQIGRSLVEKSLTEEATDTLVRGVLATARADVKHQPNLPKRNSEEYRALCEWAKIPRETIEQGYITFHFPTLTELLTKLAEDGQPIPKGILGVIPRFSCTFRKRNGDTDE